MNKSLMSQITIKQKIRRTQCHTKHHWKTASERLNCSSEKNTVIRKCLVPYIKLTKSALKQQLDSYIYDIEELKPIISYILNFFCFKFIWVGFLKVQRSYFRTNFVRVALEKNNAKILWSRIKYDYALKYNNLHMQSYVLKDNKL